MADIHVDERGFVRDGHAKLCRVTEAGIEFLASDRTRRKEPVTVPIEQLSDLAKRHLQTHKNPSNINSEE